MNEERTYTAFLGDRRLAEGSLEEVLPAVKAASERAPENRLLVFEDGTGRQTDFDLRGDLEEVMERIRPHRPRSGPGRPRLGVVSREISLLPRHWEWLEDQPKSISATLRLLVDEARKRESPRDRARRAADSTYRVMSALAGDRENFEEACRSLYAGEEARFQDWIRGWPEDIRRHIEAKSRPVFRSGDIGGGG